MTAEDPPVAAATTRGGGVPSPGGLDQIIAECDALPADQAADRVLDLLVVASRRREYRAVVVGTYLLRRYDETAADRLEAATPPIALAPRDISDILTILRTPCPAAVKGAPAS